MTIEITVYEVASGRILRTVTCPADLAQMQLREGEAYIGGHFDRHAEYVVEGIAIARPVCPAAMDKAQIAASGVETATLSGLPAPCTVALNEVAYEVTDGVFEVSFDTPGTYVLKVKDFPYLDAEFTVEAV